MAVVRHAGRQAGSVAGAHGGRWREGKDAKGGIERREPGGKRNRIEIGRVARYGGR